MGFCDFDPSRGDAVGPCKKLSSQVLEVPLACSPIGTSISRGDGVLLFIGLVEIAAGSNRAAAAAAGSPDLCLWCFLKKLCVLITLGGIGINPSICTHSNPACSSSERNERSSCHSVLLVDTPRIMATISPFLSPFRAETRPDCIGGNNSLLPVPSISQISRSPPED